MTDERPLCRCHGEPMMKNGHSKSGSQKWSCAEQRRRISREKYQALDGVAYNHLLLRIRRRKALGRRRKREERS